MICAYFGGLGADKRSSYELLLRYSGLHYTVTAVTKQPYVERSAARLVPWRWHREAADGGVTQQLYRGQDVRTALRVLLRAARAASLAEHGQRFCYVLPSVAAQPGALAAIIPDQLRYDGSLPMHPQLWQVGRSLDTLPPERHVQACMDARLFVDERSQSAFA